MKCPFCDTELKEGQVFCEKCGNEIHLVPLFEPEVEATMQSSIREMMDELRSDEEEADQDTTEYTVADSEGFLSKLTKNRRIWIPTLIVLAMIIIAIMFLCGISLLSVPVDFSTYLQKAKDAYSVENYEGAIKQLDNALAEGTTDNELLAEAYLFLARSYVELSDFDTARKYLNEGIAKTTNNDAMYSLLLSIEEQDGNYDKMAQILSNITSESILAQYAGYICNPPRFDKEEGSYFEIVCLKLLSDGVGKIYYTINGEEPTAQSEEYISPIKLENGSFQMKAVFVNEYGVMSDVASAKYDIKIVTPDEPEVSLDSGTYNEPQTIDVFMVDDTYSVYYTLDGSDPDLSSIKYEGSIALPFGKSHYRFIMYDEDGVASDIADRVYEFNLEGAAIGLEQARIMLIQNQIVNGVILDVEGHVAGSDIIHTYTCTTAFKQDGSIYYLFCENASDSLDNSIRTGNLFGVNIMTGEICHVNKSENGGFFIN